MTRRYAFTSTAMLLAMALSVTLPSVAGAKQEGRGNHGRGHSSDDHPGRGHGRSGGKHSSGRIRADETREHRSNGGSRGEWRSGGGGERRSAGRGETRQWRSNRGVSPFELQRQYRRGGDARARDRGDGRYGSRGGDWDGRAYTQYRRSHDGGRRQTTYRHRDGGRSYGGHRAYGGRSYATYGRPYYGGSFYRPHFHRSSVFSIGFVIGTYPTYRYGYFDPYCGDTYLDLGGYYEHCHEFDHPEVIVINDYRGGHPLATCVYEDGYWVVDDCYE